MNFTNVNYVQKESKIFNENLNCENMIKEEKPQHNHKYVIRKIIHYCFNRYSITQEYYILKLQCIHCNKKKSVRVSELNGLKEKGLFQTTKSKSTI